MKPNKNNTPTSLPTTISETLKHLTAVCVPLRAMYLNQSSSHTQSGVQSLIDEVEKHHENAAQSLLAAFEKHLPEKKTDTADGVAEAKAQHWINQGYNQAITDITQLIKKLKEASNDK